MLKSYGWVVVGGLEQFSVSPRPLGFGFGTKGFGAKGLGLRVWGQGLTIKMSNLSPKRYTLDQNLCEFEC